MRDGDRLPELEAILELRKRLWLNGYRPIAIQSWQQGGKAPIGTGWQLRCQQDPPEAAVLPAIAAAMNTGVWCGGLRIIDLDIDSKPLVVKVLALAFEVFGATIVRERENSPRCALVYRATVAEPLKRIITGDKHSTRAARQIEVLGKGQQFAACGTHHTDVPLLWRDDRGPAQVPLADLPAITEDQLTVFLQRAGELIGTKATRLGDDKKHRSGKAKASPLAIAGALADIPNTGPPNWDYWSLVGMAASRATGSNELAFSAFDEWSKQNSSYNKKDNTRKRWDHWTKESPPSYVGAGTIFWLASEARKAARAAQGSPALEGAAVPVVDVAAKDGPYFNPQAPIDLVRRFVRQQQLASADLLSHQGVVHRYTGTHYQAEPDEWVRAALYPVLERAERLDSHGNVRPYGTTKARITDAHAALRGVTNVAAALPTWIGADQPFPPDELLITTTGILHIPTGMLHAHRPEYFCVNALPYGFDPGAPPPDKWLTFLKQLWPEDQGEIAALQELFGLCLTPHTYFQKLFMLVGPPRSGKGTIARALTAMVGSENICSPTLAALGERFGLAPLIGKRVAIVADARLTGRTDQAAIVERLLNMSGEDSQTIDRKHIGAWNGRLDARCLILTNELPRFIDASGAIASRFVFWTLPRSFLGKEDIKLIDRLLIELPGILNWALEGWASLAARGKFIMPASSEQIVQRMADLTSPISRFVREVCVVDPYAAVERSKLYVRWCAWCATEGFEKTSSARFGQQLAAAVPTLGEHRPRQVVAGEKKRPWEYLGIKLADTPTDEQDGPPVVRFYSES
jgi:putative DNA primase/helicase